ncbi:hypothetical protein Y032_0179g713 [Ancylostoma ceylanicum]|nr:hypothetical protein Y032_0179g713 [Ancylostoma ceylanicum]
MHPDEQIWNGVLLELDDEEIANDLIRVSATSRAVEEAPMCAPPRLSSLEHYSSNNHVNKVDSVNHLQRDMQLVDISAPSSNGNGRYSPDESSIALLEYPTIGFKFDLYEPEKEPTKVQIERGTLLKPLSELDDPRVIAFLKREQGELRRKDALLARDVLCSSVYAVIPKTNVMRLTDDQAMLLFAIEDTERRVQLYHDFESFDFVRGLRKGDMVFVEDFDKMYSGRISRIGERPYAYGTWFNVEIPASSAPFPPFLFTFFT